MLGTLDSDGLTGTGIPAGTVGSGSNFEYGSGTGTGRVAKMLYPQTSNRKPMQNI